MLCNIVEFVKLCCKWEIGNLEERCFKIVFVIFRLFLVFLKLMGFILCGIVLELILFVLIFCLKYFIEMYC